MSLCLQALAADEMLHGDVLVLVPHKVPELIDYQASLNLLKSSNILS